MTPGQIVNLEWKDIKMDINSTISSVFLNAGNWVCVATPNRILVRANEMCEFSGDEEDNFD